MDLPQEVWEKIFNHLSAEELAVCSKVSKRWRSLIDSQQLWFERSKARRFNPKLNFTPYSPDHLFKTELEDLCHWRQVYDKNQILYNKWYYKNWTQYCLGDGRYNSVFCMSCDETILSIGYRDGVTAVWDIERIPMKENLFSSVLDGFPVLTIKATNKYLVIVQKRLLQVFDIVSKELKLLISFELGEDNMEISDKKKILKELFTDWYEECLRYNEVYSCCKLIFALEGDTVLVSKAGDPCVYVWDILNMSLTDKVDLETGVKDLIGWEGKIYLAAIENGLSRVSVYRSGKVDNIITSGGTSKLLVSRKFIVGIPGEARFSLQWLRVWGAGDYKLISSRPVSGLDPQAVVTECDLIIYSEDMRISVWDPVKEFIISTFSVGQPVALMKTSFSDFLVVLTDCGLVVYDWSQGVPLYNLFSRVDWKGGGHRKLICLTPTAIIAGGINNQPFMLSLI